MRNFIHISEGRRTILPDLTFFSLKITAVLAEILLTTCVMPAFLSCEHSIINTDIENTRDSSSLKHHSLELAVTKPETYESLDIFTFDDDKLRRLDSYQKINYAGKNVDMASRSGRKIIVALANTGFSEKQLMHIRKYDDLLTLYTDLKNENPEYPVMCCEKKVNVGNNGRIELELKALMAEIRINSLCCDFHARPYNGEKLENVRVYLTNVCSRVPLTGTPPKTPESILNYGKFIVSDTLGFSYPGLIFRKVPIPVGENVIFPNIRLYCYGNLSETETLGSPFTRLVIEGELQGKKTYYPLDINREQTGNENCGITGNNAYIFDITITRRGMDNPDTVINTESIDCPLKIIPWEQLNNRTIKF